ncbi:AlkZ family DNA glycosylase [Frankia sp. AgB1.9]|nr:AlkZ family DNA glycosylase [Frankia sp. AgW1.1]MBL7548444.1 AlkZ family DNA glycosylase [Frankia sp. AgB1.9]MBL7621334.1 AlkZ family DNA glycosylase [Frankia sp. AgB1.8]
MRRVAAQLLASPLPARPTAAQRVQTVVQVVGQVLAVQAQDLRGLRLAIRSRAAGLTVADVDRAFAERRLVVTWLNRGTLHLVRAEDYGWLHALTASRQEVNVRRRLGEEGVSPAEAERGVALVERALADDGPLSRAQLRDRLAAAGVPVVGQALIHILGLASLRGLLVRGPIVGSDQAYVLVRDWLGTAAETSVAVTPVAVTSVAVDAAPLAGVGDSWTPVPVADEAGGSESDRDTVLARLTVRYLAAHGPAGDRDLAAWSGLPLTDARRGLALAASSGRTEPAGAGLADLAGRPHGLGDVPWDEVSPDSLPTRLLGPFDPILHGWAAREWVTGPYRSIVTVNGIFRAIALVAGRAAGTWTMPAGQVSLAMFEPLPAAVELALRAESADVQRFFAAGPGPAAGDPPGAR